MGNGGVFQLPDHFLALHQHLFLMGQDPFPFRSQGKIHRQIGGDPQFFHIGFKIHQFHIDFLVPLAFGPVHIIQFAENHIESFPEGIEMDDFPSLFIPIAFHPEIRIDQQQ